MTAPPPRRLVFAEPSLVDWQGHSAELLRGYLQGARACGVAARALGHQARAASLAEVLGIEPWFTAGYGTAGRGAAPLPAGTLVPAMAADLRRLLGSLAGDEVLVLTTLTKPLLLALSRVLASGEAALPQVIGCAHDAAPILRPGAANAERRDQVLARLGGLGRLPAARQPLLYAYSPRVAPLLAAATGLPVPLLPLPMIPAAQALPPPPRPPGRGRLATPGSQRPARGLALLPALAAALAERMPGWDWSINGAASHRAPPTERAALAALSALEGIQLLPGPLASEAHWAQILDADLILLPYDAATYRLNGSGVFTEAVALGRACIVPAGTVMADAIDAGAAAGVSFAAFSAAAIQQALERAIATVDQLRRQALERAPAWRAARAPAAVVGRLLADLAARRV